MVRSDPGFAFWEPFNQQRRYATGARSARSAALTPGPHPWGAVLRGGVDKCMGGAGWMLSPLGTPPPVLSLHGNGVRKQSVLFARWIRLSESLTSGSIRGGEWRRTSCLGFPFPFAVGTQRLPSPPAPKVLHGEGGAMGAQQPGTRRAFGGEGKAASPRGCPQTGHTVRAGGAAGSRQLGIAGPGDGSRAPGSASAALRPRLCAHVCVCV